MPTFACAFKFAVFEAADAHSTRDRQTINKSPKQAVFRVTETMAVRCCLSRDLQPRVNSKIAADLERKCQYSIKLV